MPLLPSLCLAIHFPALPFLHACSRRLQQWNIVCDLLRCIDAWHACTLCLHANARKLRSQMSSAALSKDDKEQLFRIVSHCDCLGSGKVVGKGKADVTAFFKAIHSAAGAVFDPLPRKLAQLAADMGCDKELAMNPPLPVFPKFDPLAVACDATHGDHVAAARSHQSMHQALHMHWLSEAFEDDLTTFFETNHPTINVLEVCATTLILQSACVKSEVEKIAAPFGNFRSADVKGIPRALEKMTNPLDYHGPNGVPPGKRWDRTHAEGIEPSGMHGDPATEQTKATARVRGSAGCVVDVIRCSLETEDNAKQERFVHALRTHEGGSVFQALRQKSTLHTLSDVKQCLMNFLCAPRHANGKGKPVTFKDMVQNPAFTFTMEAAKWNHGLDEVVFAACLDLLRHPGLANQPIQLITEIQLHLSVFLRARKDVHACYKMARSDNLMSLTMDCVKFAASVHNGMACAPDDVAGRLLLKLHTVDIASESWNLDKRDLTDKDLRAVGQLLTGNQNLQTLRLQHIQVSDAAARVLSNALAKHGALTTLDLTNAQLSDAGVRAFGEALAESRTLRLSNNDVSDDGARGIGESLAKNDTLTTLELGVGSGECRVMYSDGRLLRCSGTNDAFENALDIPGLLQRNKVLHANGVLCKIPISVTDGLSSGEWNLERQHVGKEDAFALGQLLGCKHQFRSLNLTANQMSDAGVRALWEGLANDTTLLYLDLRGNHISDDGVRGLGEAMAKNSALTDLYLSENQISDAGARELGAGLSVNSTMCRLYLRDNQISDAGARAIGEGLAKNSTLTHLNLKENEISDAGARELGAGLSKNKSLSVLYLTRNQISDAGARGLGQGLAKNRHLTVLDVCGNNISAEGEALLKSSASPRLSKLLC